MFTMPTDRRADEELVRRLPLPLAQLYRRAHNAKTPLERHQAGYFLWEAGLKLLGSIAVVEYAAQSHEDEELEERLHCLSRPALGHWWEFVRRLVPILADAGDEAFGAIRDLLLGRPRDDLPRAAGLDAALREVLDLGGGARSTVRLSELFDRLVHYRNRELGHGAPGQRPSSHYDRMGRSLLAGLSEVFAHLDVLAGRDLFYVEDVRRQASGGWLVERYQLVGETARRAESMELPASDASQLPVPGQVNVSTVTVGPHGPVATQALRSLHPLVLHDVQTGEIFFLNARRGKKRSQYLCYSTGRVEDREELATEHRALLARVLGVPVDRALAEEWSLQSQTEATESPEPAPVGRRVGEFELLTTIGRGGMGMVYRAWQPSLGRQVALKCLLRAGDPRAEARFGREIRSLGRVEHPHLVKIFTSGAEGDQWFYAMELIEGADLANVCEHLAGSSASEVSEEAWQRAVSRTCKQARAREESISSEPRPTPEVATAKETAGYSPEASSVHAGRAHVAQVVELIRQGAEAAHALHEAHVVHRDIKPGNIMVTPDGTHAVLMDLGLAQLADDTEGRLTLTRQFVGTLRYASPEQVLAVGALDRRSDVYSLGATLWELLTLRPLFGATEATPTPELMRKIELTEPDRPRRHNPAVRRDLEAIVLKCLEKEPERRYLTAADLALDLRRWQQGEPVHAQPPTLRYVAGKYIRRHRVRFAALALVLFAIILGTCFAFYRVNVARHDALHRLARLVTANGVRLMDEGDLLGSLTWFAEALRLEEGNRVREEVERTRLAVVMRHCPKLAGLWYHGGPLRCAAISGDWRRLVTGGEDGTAKIWDVATGDLLATVRHDGRIWCATFSDDGRFLATSSDDGTARVWNGVTGERVTPPVRQEGPVECVALSRDGRIFATGSHDQTARVWDARTGAAITAPLLHDGLLKCVAFSRDGGRLITAGTGRTARIWDARTGEPLARPMAGGGEIWHLDLSRDGRRLVTGNLGGAGRVWDMATGERVSTLVDATGGAVFSPDGRRLIAGGDDGRARIYEADTGEPLTPWMVSASGLRATAFGPDGRYVATATEGGSARIWDAATGEPAGPALNHAAGVRFLRFSPAGHRILSASIDGVVRLWELAVSPAATPDLGPGAGVSHAAFSPDGRLVLTAGKRRTARVWDAATGNPVSPLLRHDSDIDTAAFSPDSRRVATGSSEGMARVWDAVTGMPLTGSLPHDGKSIRRIAFSPDGALVVTGGSGGLVRWWDARTGRQIRPPVKHGFTLQHLEFSPGGNLIVTAGGAWRGETREARLWYAGNGEPHGPPLRLSGPVHHARFSPDGRWIVTAGAENTGWLWEVERGIRILPLGGKWTVGDAFCPLEFSPGSDRLAMGWSDNSIDIWDLKKRLLQATARQEGAVTQTMFSPCGLYVASAGKDSAAHLWDAATGEALTPSLAHGDEVRRVCFNRDGTRLLTAGTAGARIWSLGADRRPIDDLRRLAQVLSGSTVNADSTAVQLPPETLLRLWRELRAVYPDDFVASSDAVAAWHRRQAERCLGHGEWTLAISHLGLVIRRGTPRWLDLAARGRAHAELAKWELAARDFEAAAAAGADMEVWQDFAMAQLGRGDTVGYRSTCRRLLEQFGATEHALPARRIAWTCAVLPGAVEDTAPVVKLAERALAVDDGSSRCLEVLGSTLVRAAAYERAVAALTESIENSDDGKGTAITWLLSAMAHRHSGQNGEAREWYDKAVRWISDARSAGPDGDDGSPAWRAWRPWQKRLAIEHLRREAEALIEAE